MQPLNLAANLLAKLKLRQSGKRETIILDGISGVLKPGRLTLLMGPPSAGKTTLLKALAGKLRGVRVRPRLPCVSTYRMLRSDALAVSVIGWKTGRRTGKPEEKTRVRVRVPSVHLSNAPLESASRVDSIMPQTGFSAARWEEHSLHAN